MKLFGLFAVALSAVSAATPECEVCNDFLGRAEKVLKEEKITGDDAIEKRLRELCKDAKEQDNRFCYYTGLASDSATTMHKVILFNSFLATLVGLILRLFSNESVSGVGRKPTHIDGNIINEISANILPFRKS